MEVPILKLTVENGPKQGEALEKKPGTKLRIGRILRGNNFTIKDDGISSNHLLIEVQDSSWVIKDLDTSNGTFLNGVQLDPNSPFILKDGDFIKIGEWTSMKVSLVEEIVEKTKQSKGVKKTGKTASSSVSVVAGEVELEGGGVQLRRNPRRGAAAVMKEQVVETTNLVPEVVSRGGRGRGRKKAALKNETAEIVVDGVTEVNIGDDSESVAEVIVSESREVIGGNSSKGKKVADSPEVEVGDSPKGKKVAESPEDEVGDSSKGKNVASGDTPEKSTNEEKMTLEKLNKMTLGEWFDYLEIYLVKQINKETDEVVDDMRAKAEKFKTFMSEQQKLKK